MITQKLCECGCGEFVKKENRFIFNHHGRGALYWKIQKGPQLCKCGCGDYAKPGKDYIHTHCWNGMNHSLETRKKISISNTGKIISKKTRAKLSAINLGKTHSEETKLKSSIGHMRPNSRGYCDVWSDKEYVNDIRKPYCETCGMSKMMSVHLFGALLCTHHMNGKKECAPTDIQTLCTSCHTKLHNKIRDNKNGDI